MSEVANLDAKRSEKRTTIELIEAVFSENEIPKHDKGWGIVVYGYEDAEGDQFFAVATGGDAPTSNYLGLMNMAAYHLFTDAQINRVT